MRGTRLVTSRPFTFAAPFAYCRYTLWSLRSTLSDIFQFPGWRLFSLSPVPWAFYLTFTQNISMAMLGTFGTAPLAATWSLAVEEQFYLTMPLIVRKIRRSHLTVFLVAVVVAAPVARIALHFYFGSRYGNFAAYVLMPCRADALSLGVLCAVLVRTRRAWELLLANRRALLWVTGFLFLGLFPMTPDGYALNTAMAAFGYSWLALFYTGCLLIAVLPGDGLSQKLLGSRILPRLGTLAYCTYLVHIPLIQISRRVAERWIEPHSAAEIIGGLVGVCLALLTAKISWNFFEKPLLRRGHVYKY